MANPTTCYYHPESRGTASCPNCKQLICDRCRLNGNSRRCASCETAVRKGEGGDAGRPKRVICANHAGIPADMSCVQCQKPYCPACLNTAGRCFRCASAQGRPAPSAPRRISATTPLSPAGTGKLVRPAASREMPVLSLPAMLTLAASMFILGAGVVVLLMRHASAGPVRGPLRVAIVSPSHQARLTGGQNIKLKVSSASDISRVELTIDGKYWDRFKAPPFESPWPTSLFPNGHHLIVAKAVYRDRREAVSQLEVTTWNKP